MDHLGFLESFLAVIETGSLSAAARRQSISQPAISQQMAALERHYGKKLLHRSSNGAQPTVAGVILQNYATQLHDSHSRLLANFEALERSPTGRLRISTSQALGQLVLGDLVLDMRKSHPDLEVILKVEDRIVDVVSEGYDLAVRIGGPGDGQGLIRRIGMLDTVLVASPAYLDRHGRPQNPETLEQIDYIQYNEDRASDWLPIFEDKTEVQAPVRVSFTVDGPTLMLNALTNGLGFSRAPLFMVNDLLKSGALERVLPGYRLQGKPLYLVYPHRHALTARAQIMIRSLCQTLARIKGIHLISSFGDIEHLDPPKTSVRDGDTVGPVAQLVRAERS